MSKKKNVDPEVSAAASALGSKGGSAASGDKKRRDPNHYGQVLAEARRKAAMLKKLNG
jgi:hypothetical protein